MRAPRTNATWDVVFHPFWISGRSGHESLRDTSEEEEEEKEEEEEERKRSHGLRMKPSPLPNTRPAGSEWKVTVRSGVLEDSLKGAAPPRTRVATSSPSVTVSMSLSLMFSLRGKGQLMMSRCHDVTMS
ncbi:hypothetical protein EYF80_064641 [Liparis tanakae]|uniref:Uncharacterized protein n=1 Tax=Liparis tanakae TaxID=230148 RepID=A0A4Z2EAE0_9TELE|nr:hypothetical protein EYF80_064641 [Liparis tanakae]